MNLATMLLICLGTLSTADDPPPAGSAPAEAVPGSAAREALRQRSYPWYDRESDQVIPLFTNETETYKNLGERLTAIFRWIDRQLARLNLGSMSGVGKALGMLPTFLFILFGGLLALLLWKLWRLHEPSAGSSRTGTSRVGHATRIAGLPSGDDLENADPWAEAQRLRERGDRAGAVIWLFLDQLLGLERAGLLRLTPGRTARQYVGGLADAMIRENLGNTLRVFEGVYYGHHVPSAEVVDDIWRRAQAVRERISTLRETPS